MAATRDTNRQAARGETLEAVVARRIARRSFLKGTLAAVPLLMAGPLGAPIRRRVSRAGG